MKIFNGNKSRIWIMITFIVLGSTITATASARETGSKPEAIVGFIFNPVQTAIYSAVDNVRDAFDTIVNVFDYKKENKRLEDENKALKSTIMEYEKVIGKSEYLKNEQKLRKSSKYDFLSAKISAQEQSGMFEKFTINKGSSSGLKKGDAVIVGVEYEGGLVVEGLVGVVQQTGETWAKVTSIIDPSSNISVSVIRTMDTGIVKGSLKPKLEGYMLAQDTGVKEGDKVITSGIGGVYKDGLYVGTVENVEKDSRDLLTQIEVKPYVNFGKLNEVFVILSEREQE